MKKVNVLATLIAGIDSGKDVSRRRLFRAIGSTALAKMERAWRTEVQSRGYKPLEITEYARRLGIALRKYGKADLHSVRGSVKAGRLFEVAESDFENALEYLTEMLRWKPDLRMWIDRDVGGNSHIEFHPAAMPYPIWSKSNYARKAMLPKRRIRDFKREALEEALEKLERRAKQQAEPVPNLTTVVRSRSCSRVKDRDFSDWKF
jgi:hypothetical protein